MGVGHFQQLVAGQHAFGVGQEGIEEVVFHRGQRDLVARIVEHRLLFDIDHAAPDADAVWRAAIGVDRGHGAAQDGLDPAAQFGGFKGFAKLIVGTHFKAYHTVKDLAHPGQHQDGRIAFGAQPAGQGQAILARHFQVANHEVGADLGHKAAPLLAVVTA